MYEKKHPFPSLLINYDYSSYIAADSNNDDDRDPNWLSQMFEYGFIRFIKLTSHYQASQLPHIIQDAIKGFNSPFVSIRCWSMLPKWERDNWINVQPLKHLILINGHTLTLTKGYGLKEILICPLIILLLLQNVGEIVLITKLLMLLKIYGKIITSLEVQTGFLSLVPDHILMPLLNYELLIIVIQEVFSSQGKLQCLSQFYIVDSLINMLLTMSMDVILHKALLILLMVIHLMPPLINEFIPAFSTV